MQKRVNGWRKQWRVRFECLLHVQCLPEALDGSPVENRISAQVADFGRNVLDNNRFAMAREHLRDQVFLIFTRAVLNAAFHGTFVRSFLAR